MLGNMLLSTLLTKNQMVYRNIEKGKMSPDMLEIAMKPNSNTEFSRTFQS